MEPSYWEVVIIFENGIHSHDFDEILFHLSYYIEVWGGAHGRAQLIPLGMWLIPSPPHSTPKWNFRLVQSCGSLVTWVSWTVFKSLVVSRCA